MHSGRGPAALTTAAPSAKRERSAEKVGECMLAREGMVVLVYRLDISPLYTHTEFIPAERGPRRDRQRADPRHASDERPSRDDAGCRTREAAGRVEMCVRRVCRRFSDAHPAARPCAGKRPACTGITIDEVRLPPGMGASWAVMESQRAAETQLAPFVRAAGWIWGQCVNTKRAAATSSRDAYDLRAWRTRLLYRWRIVEQFAAVPTRIGYIISHWVTTDYMRV